jgi:hypothetical protein
MARLTMRIMKGRYDRSIKVISVSTNCITVVANANGKLFQQFGEDPVNRKHPLQAYMDFCQV